MIGDISVIAQVAALFPPRLQWNRHKQSLDLVYHVADVGRSYAHNYEHSIVGSSRQCHSMPFFFFRGTNANLQEGYLGCNTHRHTIGTMRINVTQSGLGRDLDHLCNCAGTRAAHDSKNREARLEGRDLPSHVTAKLK